MGCIESKKKITEKKSQLHLPNLKKDKKQIKIKNSKIKLSEKKFEFQKVLNSNKNNSFFYQSKRKKSKRNS